MTMDVPIDQLRRLPLEKRLEIIEALWESVEMELGPEPLASEKGHESAHEVHLAEREQTEFDRRLAAHKQNPGAATPVDTFLDELDRRYA